VSSEHKLLAALMVDRKVHETLADYMEKRDFTAQGDLISREIARYYDEDKDARRVDPELLIERIGRTLPNAKQLEGFREIIKDLPYDIGAQNVAQSILEHKREGAAERLQNALAVRSSADKQQISKLLQEYATIHDATTLEALNEVTLYESNVEDMFANTLADSNKIKVAPRCLNDMLGGGALPGHCIIIFGRVEMGKSLCAINMAVGFVAQGLRVFFVENEDTLVDTRRRFIQRLLRKSREWCMKHPAATAAKAAERGLDRFLLTEEPETAEQVEAAIKQLAPDVVIINQMRNMVSGDTDNVVSKLDALAHKLRRIGKRHRKLMVLVTAAREGDSDRNGYVRAKPVLEIGDVYSSRTGIPAAADALLGWGGSDQMKANGQACINVCKNKLVDEGGHGHMYLSVNPATGVVEGDDH
jgi:archaellum biogenesis ATPase FlaH